VIERDAGVGVQIVEHLTDPVGFVLASHDRRR
jgi:hypothetical protein